MDGILLETVVCCLAGESLWTMNNNLMQLYKVNLKTKESSCVVSQDFFLEHQMEFCQKLVWWEKFIIIIPLKMCSEIFMLDVQTYDIRKVSIDGMGIQNILVTTANVIDNVLYIIPKYFEGQLLYFDLLESRSGLTKLKDWEFLKARITQKKFILDCDSYGKNLYFTIPDTSLIVCGNKDGLNGFFLAEKERISCIAVSSDEIWAISETRDNNELVRYDYEGNVVNIFNIPEQGFKYCRIFFLNNKLFMLPTTTDIIMMYDILSKKWSSYKANKFSEHNLAYIDRKSWFFWDYQNDESYIYFGTVGVGCVKYGIKENSFVTEKIMFPSGYSRQDYANDLLKVEFSRGKIIRENLVINGCAFINYIIGE